MIRRPATTRGSKQLVSNPQEYPSKSRITLSRVYVFVHTCSILYARTRVRQSTSFVHNEGSVLIVNEFIPRSDPRAFSSTRNTLDVYSDISDEEVSSLESFWSSKL